MHVLVEWSLSSFVCKLVRTYCACTQKSKPLACLVAHLWWVKVTTISYVGFYSVCFEDKAPAKRGISLCAFVESTLRLNFRNMYQLCGFFKHGSICLICLKMDICGVWICVCVPMKGIVFLRIITCLKNCVKIGFIAVNLTELSSSKTGINLL